MLAVLKSQIETLSDSAKYGLVLLGALLGFDVATRSGDIAETQASARDAAQAQFAGVGEGLDLATWRERADAASQSLEAWRGRLWSGPTPGIVAADIQAHVNAVGGSFNLSGQKTEVDPEPIVVAQGQGLRFRVQASIRSSAQFARFFGALEEGTPVLFVDELSLTIARDDRGFFELSGIAPIDIAPPESADPSPAAEARS